MFRARQSPDFLRYWFGGLLSSTGTSLQNVAAAVLILELTGSPLWIGYLSAATYGPLLLFGLIGGAVSDRWGRRRVVDLTSVASFVVSAGLAFLAAIDRATPAVLLLSALLLGTSYAFAKPNWSALLPSLVTREDLASASAISVLQFNAGNILGALGSSVILLVWGPAAAFAVNAVTFVGPMVAVRRIRARLPDPAATPSDGSRRPSTFAEVGEGLAFFGQHRELLLILVQLVVLVVGAEAFRTLAAPLSGAIVGEERLAGMLLTAASVPMALVLLVYGRARAMVGVVVLRDLGFAMQGLGLLGVGLADGPVVAVAAASLLGAGGALVLPGLSAALQSEAPTHLLGRVSSAFAVTHIGLRPVGGLAAGLLGGRLGAQSALLLLGVAPLASASVGSVQAWRHRVAREVG